MGLPTARYILENGLEVYGFDINPKAVEVAKNHGIKAETSFNSLTECDAYVICVSTLVDKNKPNIAPIIDSFKRISALKTNKETLISIESTMPPTSSRELFKQFLGPNYDLIHVPHRYWAEDPINHGVKQTRVIGAIDSKSLENGLGFYRDRLHIPLHVVDSIESAEACKVLENAYRFIQIAFAEEAKMILQNQKIDFEEVREACNTKWNILIPEAREGVGGHCLPKDILYLASLDSKHPLIDGAMKADQEYSVNQTKIRTSSIVQPVSAQNERRIEGQVLGKYLVNERD